MRKNRLMELMKFQGKLRLKYINLGINEDLSGTLAADTLHIIATSDLIKPDYLIAYDELMAIDQEPLPDDDEF